MNERDSSEKNKLIRWYQAVVFAASVAGVLWVVPYAFSSISREEIRRRDRKCRICGAISHLEASHINHDRTKKEYDDPRNGELLCMFHHFLYHLEHKGKAHLIGLSESANDWSIQKIFERLAWVSDEEVTKLKEKYGDWML